jgi:hypothetical protein
MPVMVGVLFYATRAPGAVAKTARSASVVAAAESPRSATHDGTQRGVAFFQVLERRVDGHEDDHGEDVRHQPQDLFEYIDRPVLRDEFERGDTARERGRCGEVEHDGYDVENYKENCRDAPCPIETSPRRI